MSRFPTAGHLESTTTTSAHRLYEAEGDPDRPIYAGAEVPDAFGPDWRFMELDPR